MAIKGPCRHTNEITKREMEMYKHHKLMGKIDFDDISKLDFNLIIFFCPRNDIVIFAAFIFLGGISNTIIDQKLRTKIFQRDC